MTICVFGSFPIFLVLSLSHLFFSYCYSLSLSLSVCVCVCVSLLNPGELPSQHCHACPIGWQQRATKKSFCNECAFGKYQNEMAKTICVDCPVNTFSTLEGGNRFGLFRGSYQAASEDQFGMTLRERNNEYFGGYESLSR